MLQSTIALLLQKTPFVTVSAAMADTAKAIAIPARVSSKRTFIAFSRFVRMGF
jgi:hypothetical protein